MTAFVMALSMLAADPASPPEPAQSAVMTAGAIFDEDYPSEARARNHSGSVGVRYIVNQWGYVSECTVLESSRVKVLDDATCKIIKERFVFKPALDAGGKPMAETRQQTVSWRLPSPKLAPMDVSFELTVQPDGSVTSCKLLKFEVPPEAGGDPCENFEKRPRFQAFSGETQKRAVFQTRVIVYED